MSKEWLLNGLTPEQIEKVKGCKSQDELLAIAKEEGVELNDEQLEAVSGGLCTPSMPKCERCGSNDNVYMVKHTALYHWKCTACNYCWSSKFW